jgi:ABC-type antimicrobial peptide transport system permease subunit
MTLVPSQFKDKEKIGNLATEALRRLRADVRIESAAFAVIIPFNNQANQRTNVHTEMDATETNLRFNNNTVSSAFFATIGIPLLEGREFKDTISEANSVILSKTFATRLFGRKSPIGRKIFLAESGSPKAYEIIGVSADIKHMGFGEEDSLALYRSMQPNRNWRTQIDLLARPRAASATTARAMHAILLDLNPSSAVETKRLGDSLGLALLPSQAGAIVFSALGLLGLALSTVGLHGTVTFSVRQRSSEIGLRMALGASPGQILFLIAKENFLTLLAGSIAGIGFAIAIAKPLAFFLVPGLQSVGIGSFAAILLGISLVATIAILGPARRAMRIDPLEALRSS